MVRHPAPSNDYRNISLGHTVSAAWVNLASASTLGIKMGSKLASRSRGTSIRTGPSPVSTVLALLPLRGLVAASGLAAPAGQPRWWPSSARMARPIRAFLKASEAALTAHRHRPGDELVKQFFGDLRQRRTLESGPIRLGCKTPTTRPAHPPFVGWTDAARAHRMRLTAVE